MKLDADFVLALLNSAIYDWFFRLTSTNAHVSHYQIVNKLPAPTLVSDSEVKDWAPLLRSRRWDEVALKLRDAIPTPGEIAQNIVLAVSGMSREIQKLEARRPLARRSERSQLGSEGMEVQQALDNVLARCLGLADEDLSYINLRLQEML
jgi:hypothetical protein